MTGMTGGVAAVASMIGDPALEVLHRLTATKRMLLVAGLPGVGKSLMVQQAALLASRHGRRTHLLRWDVSRLAFENSSAAGAFAPQAGVTHPAIRLAAGDWVRGAVGRWHAREDEDGLLIGECPLVGNRFSELARRSDDSIEAVLASDDAHFLVPVPSREARARIEALRARELEHPRHESEANNAPLDVVRRLDQEVLALANTLGLDSGADLASYVPQTYLDVYARLLRHRHHSALHVETLWDVKASAQAVPESCIDLTPSASEVATSLRSVGGLSEAQMRTKVDAWWRVDSR